jgi:hypothetical protein
MSVTITPGQTRIDLNGATAVVAVAAPAAATVRTVLSLRVFNLDSAVVTVTLQTNVGGTKKTIEKVTGLVVDGVWRPIDRDHIVVLNGTTQSLELFLAGAPAATNPHAEAAWIDRA